MIGNPAFAELGVALRRLRRCWPAAAVTVITLAAILAPASFLLTMMDVVLLRQLPYRAPGDLMVIWERSPQRGLERATASAGNFSDWRREVRSFAGVGAADPQTRRLEAGSFVARVRGARVSADYFAVLQAAFALGAGFSGADGEAGAAAEAVLSQEAWRSLFASDPAILGKTVYLDRKPYRVAGVLATGAALPPATDIFTAVDFAREASDRAVRKLFVVARLRSGTSRRTAAAELAAVERELERLYPEADRGFTTTLSPLAGELTRGIRQVLTFLVAGALLALAIGCVNLAHLELMRAARRRQEQTLRAVLGAAGFRLWRPLLIESLLLVAAGGAVGLAAALWGAPLLASFSPALAAATGGRTPWRELIAAAALLSLVAAVIICPVPILYLRSAGRRMPDAQAASGRAAALRFSPLQRTLMVLQLALSLPMLVACVALVSGFLRIQRTELGFRPEQVLTASLALPEDSAPERPADAGPLPEFLGRVAALGGVAATGAISDLPFDGFSTSSTFVVAGQSQPPGQVPPMADQHSASPGYFAAMGIPVLEGRGFDAGDTRAAPKVAIVNSLLAARFLNGRAPLGESLLLGSPSEIELYGGAVPWRVVGVVGNVRHLGLTADFRPEIYLPLAQMPAGFCSLVLRARGHGAPLAVDLRALAGTFNGQLRLGTVVPMPEVVARAAGKPGVQTVFFLLFALVSVLLVVLCTFSQVAHAVAAGARGIGISIALGAGTRQVLALVLRDLMILGVAGLLLGLLLGFAGVRALAHGIPQLTDSGLGAYAGATALLAFLLLAAGLVPARRALALDTMRLLQEET